MATDFEKDVLTLVQKGLRITNVYYAPWVILIEKTSAHNLRILAYLPPHITLPRGFLRPLTNIEFNHTQGNEMTCWQDVNFVPIAAHLSREIVKAYTYGEKYGTSEVQNI